MMVIQIKYELPYCVTCPSICTDPGIRTNTGAGDTVFSKTYLICIIAQVLANYFDTPLLAFCVRGRQRE